MPGEPYQELMKTLKSAVDVIYSFYTISTTDEGELDKFYQRMKTELIETKYFLPDDIAKCIIDNFNYRCKYLKAYFYIFKKYYEEYQPKLNDHKLGIDDFLEHKDNQYLIKENILKFYEDPSILRAILTDDKCEFALLTEEEGFDPNQKLWEICPIIKCRRYSILEFCCLCGAVGCFKILTTKFDPEITKKCIEASFLGGNADIIDECLKKQEPDINAMEGAIISHNIDFVMFLVEEYDLGISLSCCCEHYNLHAFIVYIDQNIENSNYCLEHTSYFNIPSICEFLLDHGAKIVSYDVLYNAISLNRKEIVNILISHGADINAKFDFNAQTYLIISVVRNDLQTLESILSLGADINAVDNYGQSALHYATMNHNTEIANCLVSHGIDVNLTDNMNQTALHISVLNSLHEITKSLLLHGARADIKDENGYTALEIAVRFCYKESAELIMSYAKEK